MGHGFVAEDAALGEHVPVVDAAVVALEAEGGEVGDEGARVWCFAVVVVGEVADLGVVGLGWGSGWWWLGDLGGV